MADAFSMPTAAVASAKPDAKARAEAGLIVVEGTALTMPFRVKVAAGGAGDASDVERTKRLVREKVQAVFDMAGDVFSPFNSGSDLKRLNAAPPGMLIEASPKFVEVLQLCAELHASTDGAFDPVFAATKGARRWPGSLRIDAAANKVGRVAGDVRIDLSAISKGYCVDLLATSLAADFAGFSHSHDDPAHGPGALVEWGGDIRAVGCHPIGKPWECVVPTHPGATAATSAKGDATAATVGLVSAACCTSGSFVGIREGVNTHEDGVSHLANATAPTTTSPQSKHNGDALVSATVVHSSCALADALATVVASLGTVQAAQSWLNEHAPRPEAFTATSASSLVKGTRLHRATVCALEDGKAFELLPKAFAAAMPAPLVRSLGETLRSALRPRVLMHVALCAPVGGGKCFAAAATSFAAMRVAKAADGAVDGVVARVAATHDSRLATLLKDSSGVVITVATAMGADAAGPAHEFLEAARNGRLLDEGEAAAELAAIPYRAEFRVSKSQPIETVGDHIVAFLELVSGGGGGNSAPLPDGPPTAIVARRDNDPFVVPFARLAAKGIAIGRLPVVAMCAAVTAWVPSAKGMLATTVRNLDYTSRDPPHLTFDAKDSKLDRLVFGADAAHHRVHVYTGAGPQDDTLAEWFDDGATTDPRAQFMYIAGAVNPEASSGYRLPACPAISFDVAAVRWCGSSGGRAFVVATPTMVEGAPTAGGAGSTLKATPAAVARVSRFGVL